MLLGNKLVVLSEVSCEVPHIYVRFNWKKLNQTTYKTCCGEPELKIRFKIILDSHSLGSSIALE